MPCDGGVANHTHDRALPHSRTTPHFALSDRQGKGASHPASLRVPLTPCGSADLLDASQHVAAGAQGPKMRRWSIACGYQPPESVSPDGGSLISFMSLVRCQSFRDMLKRRRHEEDDAADLAEEDL